MRECTNLPVLELKWMGLTENNNNNNNNDNTKTLPTRASMMNHSQNTSAKLTPPRQNLRRDRCQWLNRAAQERNVKHPHVSMHLSHICPRSNEVAQSESLRHTDSGPNVPFTESFFLFEERKVYTMSLSRALQCDQLQSRSKVHPKHQSKSTIVFLSILNTHKFHSFSKFEGKKPLHVLHSYILW